MSRCLRNDCRQDISTYSFSPFSFTHKIKHKLMERKIALITGATSGIGEACARKFACGGYDLILTGRNVEKLKAVEAAARVLGADVQPLVFDVRDRDAATTAVNSLTGKWAAVDVLINNAGLALKGLLTMTRLIVPGMVERNRGHVINIGSVAGDAAYAGGNVYCATKAAVKAVTDGLRIDVAHTAVRVTNVKPGLVETNFSVVRFHGDNERAGNVYKGIQPLTGDDIADVALYAANAPEHVQVAEVLVLATHQANGTVIDRNPDRVEHLS